MKKWMKAILVVFCVCFILGETSVAVSYIMDEANILESDTSLQNRAMEMSDQLNAQIVIVTLNTEQEGEHYNNIEEFGESFFYKNGFGGTNGGAMLLIDVGRRNYTVFYEGGLLTEKANKKIAEQLKGILEKDNYTEAAETYLDLIQKYAIDKEKVGLAGKDILIYLLIAAAISGMIVVILIFTRNHDTKPSGAIYIGNDGVEILERIDRFTHTTVVTHKIERDTHSKDSGSAGGSF